MSPQRRAPRRKKTIGRRRFLAGLGCAAGAYFLYRSVRNVEKIDPPAVLQPDETPNPALPSGARLPDALRAGAGHARGAGVVPLFHHVALRSDPPRDARPRVARLVRRGDLHRGLRHAHRRQRRSGSGAPGRNGPDSGFGPFARLHARRRHEDSDKLAVRATGTKRFRCISM